MVELLYEVPCKKCAVRCAGSASAPALFCTPPQPALDGLPVRADEVRHPGICHSGPGFEATGFPGTWKLAPGPLLPSVL